jgi:transcriptional regulator with PAS, ATPase and Fis domain
LEDHEIIRVGGTEAKEIDVRIIAATNKKIEEMVASKKFREDLYYRINVVPIYVTSLRERRDDILPLITIFGKIQ